MAVTVARFPVVSGTNLEGRRFTLPEDLEGEANLLLVAFRRAQQRDVDTWFPVGERLAAAHAEFRMYELPVIARGYALARPFIDGGMRAGIPNVAARARTITLYTDKPTFRRALDVHTEGAIHALLVDPAGTVHWRARGPRTDAAVRDLEEAVERMLGE